MSKKFNVNTIVNERRNELDSSPLFQTQPPPVPAQDVASATLPKKEPEDTRTQLPSPLPENQVSQSATPPVKRSFVRRTFDFYEEQIAYLKQESLREQLEGKEGSMNAMVREAINDWIAKRTSKNSPL
jgi:hypothetical protein